MVQDTAYCIQNAIINCLEDNAKVIPEGNGGLLVQVDDARDIARVLASIADLIWEYEIDDIQITTNFLKQEVFIDIIERD